MSELKPCPLCGGKPFLDYGQMTGIVAIVCPCSSHVFYGGEGDVQKTIEAWNSRDTRFEKVNAKHIGLSLN